MEILVNTGVLLRLVVRADPAHQDTRKAVHVLKVCGDRLVALTQNAVEFWNVCTRPVSTAGKGGYGLSIQETERKLRTLERVVEFRADSLAGFQQGKRLVVTHSVSGIEVHDTRLVAAMIAQGIMQIVTFNKKTSNAFQAS